MRGNMKYRKKPVVIDAIKWTGDNWDELELWCPYGLTCQRDIGSKKYVIVIDTLEGRMRADVGDWIIKGIKGEFYPIKNDIFLETYEKVD
jgi:hypothetical protein